MAYLCHVCPTDGTREDLRAHQAATGHAVEPWRSWDPATNRVIEQRAWGWQELTRQLDQDQQEFVTSGFLGDLLAELSRARLQYPPIHSLHEGYAVMLEELDEFWDICRQKPDARNLAGARKELLQVAAMAWRTAIDCL